MGLLEVIKEQVGFGFTGKINILTERSQFLGAIFLNDGQIVGCEYQGSTGLRSLKKAVFEDLKSKIFFKFIVEPEVISADHIHFDVGLDELKKQIQTDFERYQESMKFKPPGDIHLLVSPEIVLNHEQINYAEFQILKTVTEYSKVSDIYNHCMLEEYEITQALVELRRKKAIKVFQKEGNVR